MNSELDSILEEYTQLGIQQQLDYDKFYLYSIITHSTAIEGSTVTEIENQLLFDQVISANKPMTEQLMNLDLKSAYEQSFVYAKKHTDYSIELLCKLAALVMKNTGSTYKTIAGEFSSAKGELRLLNVSAGHGGKSYLAWQKVPDRLEKFCQWINEERKKIDKSNTQKIYELSFEAHYRIVSIHPWADGNGRMSRLIMNMIQYEAEIIPSIVKKESRAEYIQYLSLSQAYEDSSKFIDFMLKHHIENLRHQIADYKKSMEVDFNDNEQKTSVQNQHTNDTAKITQKITVKITVNQQKIIDAIKENPFITQDELSSIVGIARLNINKNMKKLQEQGIIKRVGADKNGHWEIVK